MRLLQSTIQLEKEHQDYALQLFPKTIRESVIQSIECPYLSAKWKGTWTVFTLPETGSTRQIW